MTSSDPVILANTRMSSRILVLAITFLVFHSICWAQKQYPNWFLHSQDFPELIVGYSTAKVLSAKEDAIWRYSFFEKGFLSGSATYFDQEDQWEKNYVTEALVPVLNEDQLTKVDMYPTSMYAGGEAIIAFRLSPRKTALTSNYELIEVNTSKPKWVGKAPFYRKGSYYYGVGQYVLRGNENDAWRTAEERALVELATAIGIEISNHFTSKKTNQENKSTSNGNESVNILTYTFDHEFENARVIERWVDYPEPNQQLYAYAYVLVKIHSKNIKHNLSRGK
jgi:hypothetical protein